MAGLRSVVLSLIALAVIAETSAAPLHPIEAELRRTFPSASLHSSAQFEAADAFIDGRATSGLRARLARLSVLYPRSYDGLVVAEAGSQRVVLRAVAAAAAPATESSGMLVYTRPYPSTDVVEVPDGGRSEELLLLRDEHAPLVYEYEIVATDGVAAVTLRDGAIRFLRTRDPNDQLPVLQIDRPWVLDASGKKSHAQWTLIGDGAMPRAMPCSLISTWRGACVVTS